jgi:NhaP-type Na+/H+ or K+/H+ antiporter
LIVILMGTLIGLLVGFAFYGIHRWLPTTPSIEIVLTLLTPYCMYNAAEYFHFSGVLAVVSGGLLLSGKRQSMLNYRSRIEGVNVWTNLVFVLNGLVFFLIGLQLPSITAQLGDISLSRAIWYGLGVSLLLIVTRLLCTLGASLFTRMMSRFITVADTNPGWKAPLILGWSGMRGVVSLAAALSIPLLIGEGQPFPYRNLILFITFIVILVSLVVQGLTLPWGIRMVNLEDKFTTIPEHRQEVIIQKKIAQYSLQYLEEKYGPDWRKNEHLNNLQARLKIDLNFYSHELQEHDDSQPNSLREYQEIYLAMLEHQRRLLSEVNHRAEFNEDLVRKYLSLVDLEELKIRNKIIQESGEG